MGLLGASGTGISLWAISSSSEDELLELLLELSGSSALAASGTDAFSWVRALFVALSSRSASSGIWGALSSGCFSDDRLQWPADYSALRRFGQMSLKIELNKCATFHDERMDVER